MEKPSTTRIELTKYRTEDLVDSLVELVSVPGAIRKVITTVLLALVLAVIASSLIRSYSSLSLLPWLAMSAYALVACVFLGGLVGMLRVVRDALGNVQDLLGQALDITAQAADDYQQLEAGSVSLPAGDELFRQVHQDVLLPALERAVSKAFGILTNPLLWIYRRTIGSAVNFVIVRSLNSPKVEAQHQRVEQLTQSSIGTMAEYSGAVQVFVSSAAETVDRMGERLRLYAMLPLWFMFAAMLLLAISPVLAALYLVGS